MALSTSILVIPTEEFSDLLVGSIAAVASDIENAWENGISYDITVSITSPINLSSYNPSNTSEAPSAAQSHIKSQFIWMLPVFDAILVRDGRDFSNPSGQAPVGKPNAWNPNGEWQAAGSDTINCIGYSTNTLSSHLETHDIGHMYGGIHRRHKKWGSWEHTIMGNSGDPTCDASNSDYRTRTNEWSSCSKTDIEHYMDTWNNINGSF